MCYCLSKWGLRRQLKVEECLVLWRSLLHFLSLRQEKDPCQCLLLKVGSLKSFLWRRAQLTRRDIDEQEVSVDCGPAPVMTESQRQEGLQSSSFWNWTPVPGLKNSRNMVTSSRPKLDRLHYRYFEFFGAVNKHNWKSYEKGVTIVQTPNKWWEF